MKFPSSEYDRWFDAIGVNYVPEEEQEVSAEELAELEALWEEDHTFPNMETVRDKQGRIIGCESFCTP